ncbi:MAG: hypothetical protein KGD59_02465 [Candidatus Heimdallarchaeota archaeon]|nr:hypothetical protein [Candidatus Heimdallarchaeota archaeon]MBY8993385.1 hypothetical protein [Candidatus Heimdallarchaeota archaeon]
MSKKSNICNKLIEEYKKEKSTLGKVFLSLDLYNKKCFVQDDIPFFVELLKNEEGLIERVAMSTILMRITKTNEEYNNILGDMINKEKDLIRQSRLVLILKEKKIQHIAILVKVLEKDKPTNDIFEVAFELLDYKEHQKVAIESIQKLQSENRLTFWQNSRFKGMLKQKDKIPKQVSDKIEIEPIESKFDNALSLILDQLHISAKTNPESMILYADTLHKLGFIKRPKETWWSKHGGTVIMASINAVGIIVVAIVSAIL